jgi:hypothetical protein
MKVFFVIAIVLALIVGLILTLRSSRNTGTPSPDVLERAKERERAQQAKDES